jgi:hypothetical protein
MYSITVIYPKSKIKQFDAPMPQPVSALNDVDFKLLLNNYFNHIDLVLQIKKDSINFNGLKYIWNTSPQQQNILSQYFSTNPTQFADPLSNPGENNLIPLEEGIAALKYIKLRKTDVINSYNELNITPIPFVKLFNKNIKIPEYNNFKKPIVSPLYEQEAVLPDLNTFKTIVDTLLKNGYIKSPLSTDSYFNKPIGFFALNNTLYKLPQIKQTAEWQPYKQSFNQMVANIQLYDFEDNIEAWKSLLGNIVDLNQNSYERYKETLGRTRILGRNDSVYFYPYKGGNYIVPTYKVIYNERPILKEIFRDVIKNKKVKNSVANAVFQEIKDEYQNLLPISLKIETEYTCSEDHRFMKLCEEIDKDQKEKNKGNIFRYLYKSTAETGKNIDGGGWGFNLSNTHFLDTNPIYENQINNGTLTEFQIKWINVSDLKTKKTRKKLFCISSIPARKTSNNKSGITTFFTPLYKSKIKPETYAFDLAIVNQNKEAILIFEFDGSDHFRPRSIKDSKQGFLNKVVADQLKSEFARIEQIPIVRIPGYHKTNEIAKQRSLFKDFILQKLKELIPNLDIKEPEKLPDKINTLTNNPQ